MKRYNYIGLFRSDNGHQYTLEVRCNGYIQALVLLTGDAIRMGRHYQLKTITDEKGDVRYVDDISKISSLIS
jgi:hypothetical protein